MYTQEGFQVGKEPEIMAMVKATTVMLLGHLVKSDNMNLCRKMIFTKAKGNVGEGRKFFTEMVMVQNKIHISQETRTR
jgi:dihydrofolate reductase